MGDREVKVVLHGSRLTGGYVLFRTGDDSWMIHRERLPLPDRIVPMLARPGDLPADDGGWAYEMKWDGLRALAYIGGGRVRLLSRTGQDITGDYPELGGLGAAVGRRQAVLDGEIVAMGGDSWPDFERLQQRMNARPAAVRAAGRDVPVTYLAFDLLHLDGRPLLDEPYRARRALLEELALRAARWQTPPSFTGEAGADVQAVSRQHGLEGIVAKRLASRYEPGKRTGGAGSRSRTSAGRRSWSAAGSRVRASGRASSARCSSVCRGPTGWSTRVTSGPASASRPWTCSGSG